MYTCNIYIYIIDIDICHWPSKADMLTQSHCSDEKDGRFGLSS